MNVLARARTGLDLKLSCNGSATSRSVAAAIQVVEKRSTRIYNWFMNGGRGGLAPVCLCQCRGRTEESRSARPAARTVAVAGRCRSSSCSSSSAQAGNGFSADAHDLPCTDAVRIGALPSKDGVVLYLASFRLLPRLDNGVGSIVIEVAWHLAAWPCWQ